MKVRLKMVSILLVICSILLNGCLSDNKNNQEYLKQKKIEEEIKKQLATKEEMIQVVKDKNENKNLYINSPLNFTITFPEVFKGKYWVKEGVDKVIFSHNSSVKKEAEYFTIYKIKSTEWNKLKDNKSNYFIHTEGDNTFYYTKPKYSPYTDEKNNNEYKNLMKKIDTYILDGFSVIKTDEIIQKEKTETIIYENKEMGVTIDFPKYWSELFLVDYQKNTIYVIHDSLTNQKSLLFSVSKINKEEWNKYKSNQLNYYIGEKNNFIYFYSLVEGHNYKDNRDIITYNDIVETIPNVVKNIKIN